MKRILSIVMIALTVLSLTGCSAKKVELVGNYANGLKEEYLYQGTPMGFNYKSTSVKVFSDETYEMSVTETIDMFGTVAGTTVTTSYGTFTKGEGVDGFLEMTLSAASRVVYASYNSLGGFAFEYDTDVDTAFIIPGGDDSTLTKDEFIVGLGLDKEKVAYIVLDSSNNESSHLEFSK